MSSFTADDDIVIVSRPLIQTGLDHSFPNLTLHIVLVKSFPLVKTSLLYDDDGQFSLVDRLICFMLLLLQIFYLFSWF